MRILTVAGAINGRSTSVTSTPPTPGRSAAFRPAITDDSCPSSARAFSTKRDRGRRSTSSRNGRSSPRPTTKTSSTPPSINVVTSVQTNVDPFGIVSSALGLPMRVDAPEARMMPGITEGIVLISVGLPRSKRGRSRSREGGGSGRGGSPGRSSDRAFGQSAFAQRATAGQPSPVVKELAGLPTEARSRVRRAKVGGSAWESNPARPLLRRQRPILKTGRATGPRSLPLTDCTKGKA